MTLLSRISTPARCGCAATSIIWRVRFKADSQFIIGVDVCVRPRCSCIRFSSSRPLGRVSEKATRNFIDIQNGALDNDALEHLRRLEVGVCVLLSSEKMPKLQLT